MQFGRCRSVSEFEKLNRIGEGTYGIVCKYFRFIINSYLVLRHIYCIETLLYVLGNNIDNKDLDQLLNNQNMYL